MPSLAELEQWMEEQIPPNLHDLPMKVHTTLQAYSAQIFEQFSDFKPSLSRIEDTIKDIPFVSNVTSSTPRPPPPTSLTEGFMRKVDVMTGSRKRSNVIAGIALVGISSALLSQALSPTSRMRTMGRPTIRSPRTKNGTRREAVVVVGADTPIGQAICHHLSAQGFIIFASVSNAQSLHNFDSLVPPSSRGYIKAIVLDPFGPQPQEISAFVDSLMACRELRWPLTSAGDPYARPGEESDIVGVVNALSYRPAGESLSGAYTAASQPGSSSDAASTLQIDRIHDEFEKRVITPLAIISALVPHLSSSQSSIEIGDVTPAVIVSLANDGGDVDASTAALRSGMKKIQLQIQALVNSSSKRRMSANSTMTRRRIVLSTMLEAHPSTLQSLFTSLLPSAIGGIAPASSSLSNATPGRRSSTNSKTDSTPEKASRPAFVQRSSSVSAMKAHKEVESKRLLDAVTALLLSPSSTQSLRSTYMVRMPAVGGSSADGTVEQRQLESTILLRSLHVLSTPFVVMGKSILRLLSNVGLNPMDWLSPCTPHYDRWANPKPAYGPGPGPASNTHSRASIKKPEKGISSNRGRTEQSSKRQRRPASAVSTSSSEAKSSEGWDSNQHGSAPPSNNGMSSSGLFDSSVPSSTFGDGETGPDLDSEDGHGSPIEVSSRWDTDNVNPHETSRTSTSQRRDTGDTPSASRANYSTAETTSGNVAPTANSEGSSSELGSRGPSAAGTRSPLGSSWVALSESQMRDSKEQ